MQESGQLEEESGQVSVLLPERLFGGRVSKEEFQKVISTDEEVLQIAKEIQESTEGHSRVFDLCFQQDSLERQQLDKLEDQFNQRARFVNRAIEIMQELPKLHDELQNVSYSYSVASKARRMRLLKLENDISGWKEEMLRKQQQIYKNLALLQANHALKEIRQKPGLDLKNGREATRES